MLEQKSKQHIAAGLLGSYNHIARLLFRVKAAVKSGATRPCTEVECSWVIPQGTAARKRRETSAIKDKYGQKVSRKRKEEGKRAKCDFQPFNESERQVTAKHAYTLRMWLCMK